MLKSLIIYLYFSYSFALALPLHQNESSLTIDQGDGQLVILTIYSNLHEVLEGNNTNNCHNIWTQPDPCQYSKRECTKLSKSIIDYTSLYYCDLKPRTGSFFGGALLAFILIFAFLFLSTIASDFFCPNLSTLSNHFKLSESVAGVTLLAFGNGSPDLFSTFSALKSGSGNLAVGELIGASWFIISVVVGSMAIFSSFHVVRHLFIRDLLFFTGAMSFMIFILRDRYLTPLESVLLMLYYIFYVISVVMYKSPAHEYSTEYTPLLSQSFLSNSELISIAVPSTYFKRMNFWSMDEISRAFSLGAGDLHPGSVQLFKQDPKFLSTSAKLNTHLSKRYSSKNPSRRCSYSSDIVLGYNSIQHDNSNIYDSDTFGIKSPVVNGLFKETRHDVYLAPPKISIEHSIPQKVIFNDNILNSLFPLFRDWQSSSFSDIIINLAYTPIIFILTLTAPIFPNNEKGLDYHQDQIFTSDITIIVPEDQSKQVSGWTLLLVQAFTIPIFIFEILGRSKLVDQEKVYWAFIIGLVFYLFLKYFFKKSSQKEYLLHGHPVIVSTLGFFLALNWISIVATEVVDILRAIGVILGINEEIIGLTVFAMGNSLGDFVANLSVARMGYPTMALSACFASPMLNLMLGTGFSGAFIGWSSGQPIMIPVTRIMLLAASGALSTLILYLIYVHLNSFHIEKRFGITLIGLYVMGIISIILITV